MPAFLLDTSALVKLYHPEPGSPFMEKLFHDPVSDLLITRLTIVEIESALAGKVRTGTLDPQGAQIASRGFRADLKRRRFRVNPQYEAHIHETARDLLLHYGVAQGLRTLDSLQLAAAIEFNRARLVSIFVTADQRLCRAAELAGCPVLNPETPGVIPPA